MLGRKERKGVVWWKVYSYQLLINIHFKTPFLKQDTRLRNGGHGFPTQFLLIPFYQYLRSIDLFRLNQVRGGGGGEIGGKDYSCSFSLPPSPRKKNTWSQDGFISETAISYQVHGSRHEKGHEQSHMSFLVVQRWGKDFVQHGDVLAYA